MDMAGAVIMTPSPASKACSILKGIPIAGAESSGGGLDRRIQLSRSSYWDFDMPVLMSMDAYTCQPAWSRASISCPTNMRVCMVSVPCAVQGFPCSLKSGSP